MEPELVVDGANIVLRGQFNPAILHPEWLAAQGLIGQEEAAQATRFPSPELKGGTAESRSDFIVSSMVTAWSVDWLELKVDDDMFIAQALDPAHFEPLRDLVLGIFSVLEHTPIHRMGLNRVLDYRLDTEERWHALGDNLVPKQTWTSLFSNRPGMRSLVVEGRRPGSNARFTRVKFEPSIRAKPYGVYVETNEHYEPDTAGKDARSTLLSELRDSWLSAVNYAPTAAAHIFAATLTPSRRSS